MHPLHPGKLWVPEKQGVAPLLRFYLFFIYFFNNKFIFYWCSIFAQVLISNISKAVRVFKRTKLVLANRLPLLWRPLCFRGSKQTLLVCCLSLFSFSIHTYSTQHGPGTCGFLIVCDTAPQMQPSLAVLPRMLRLLYPLGQLTCLLRGNQLVANTCLKSNLVRKHRIDRRWYPSTGASKAWSLTPEQQRLLASSANHGLRAQFLLTLLASRCLFVCSPQKETEVRQIKWLTWDLNSGHVSTKPWPVRPHHILLYIITGGLAFVSLRRH